MVSLLPTRRRSERHARREFSTDRIGPEVLGRLAPAFALAGVVEPIAISSIPSGPPSTARITPGAIRGTSQRRSSTTSSSDFARGAEQDDHVGFLLLGVAVTERGADAAS